MKRTITLACLLVWLIGCPSPATLGPGIRSIEAAGTFIHKPSGFEFPETFGKFNRVSINQYDGVGNNVGIGYNLDTDLKIALTLYVRPQARNTSGDLIPLSEQFEIEKSAIEHYHPGALSSSCWTPPQTQNREPSPGYATAFRYEEDFAGARRTVTSLLYLFEIGDWVVKYRITYPASQEEKANLISQVFVSGFIWRGAA